MVQWIKYASQLTFKVKSLENRNINTDTKYEIAENTLISRSIFDNIGEKGAIYLTNSSSSLIVDSSIFINCRTSFYGAAIYAKLRGASSFSFIKSCIDSCQCTASNSYGNSFCIDGESNLHIIHVEHSTITNCKGRFNDGVSIWRANSFITFLNISGCRADNGICGISTEQGNICAQKYNEYSNHSSSYIDSRGNKVDTIFRCIFRDCDPNKRDFMQVYKDTNLTFFSCTFRSCGDSFFGRQGESIVTCFDCYFDKEIQNSSLILIISKNENFKQVFTYRSLAKCTFDNEKCSKRKPNLNSFIKLIVSLLFESLLFLDLNKDVPIFFPDVIFDP